MFTRAFYAVILFSLVLWLSACSNTLSMPSMPDFGFGTSSPVTVTILHTNDFHSQHFPMNVTGEGEQGGVARQATLVKQIRAAKGKDNVLLLSGGDFFQGSLFYNTWKGSAEVMVMNEIGYDAAAMGNHEFDLGAEELARALNGGQIEISGELYDTEAAEFIALGTNINASDLPELDAVLPKSAIIKKGGQRFGLLGVTTESAAVVSSPGNKVRFEDYVTAVQREVDALEDKGINKIILMSHSGTEEDIRRIPQLSGVDMIIAGHDHKLFGDAEAVNALGLTEQAKHITHAYPAVFKDRDGHNVLVVSALEKGRWLGNLDVTFDEDGRIADGAWDANPIFVRGCDGDDCTHEAAAPDATVAARVAEYNVPIEAFAERILGVASHDFAGRHNDKPNAASLGNLVADILLAYTRESDGAAAAIVNRGGIRADLAAGEVRYKDVNAVLPFPNTAMVLELSGAELLEALDYALTGAGGQSYGAFPQVSGMEIHYCTALPCVNALRANEGVITRIAIDGEPLKMASEYRIVTNDYLARGGDYYYIFKQACEESGTYCRDTGTLLKDIVADWFVAHSPIAGNHDARIIPQTP